MKTKVLRRMWLFAALLISLALVACAPAPKKKPAALPEPDIVSKPGLYKDNIIGFSLSWPAQAFSVKADLQKDERVRVVNEATIPVLTIAVTPKKEDAPPLADIGNSFKNGLKETQVGSKRFKLRDNKLVKLANGVDAGYAMVTWKYGGSFALVTVAVVVYKGDKVITVTCTSAPGQPAVEVMEKWVMALKVKP